MSDAVVNGLAGAGGGIVAQILTYPLQAVNTRQQTERKAKASDTSQDADAAVTFNPALKVQRGTIQEIIKVIKTEGWGGLYRGLPPSLLGTACSQGVYYYSYRSPRTPA